MKLLFLMVFGLVVANVNGVEQKCDEFSDLIYFVNTYSGPQKTFYRCRIYNATLKIESDIVTTNTEVNQRSDDEVLMVLYNPTSIVKFIPNSLFTTFINLEYLFMWYNVKFETMKPEFLKNANKLKNFHVRLNDVKALGPNLFVEAANLEHINFQENNIGSIHKLAFNGLPNLQGVYLQGNQITNLDPSTFKSIKKLNILELTGANNCLNRKFDRANQTVALVEAAISESCAYNLFCDDSRAIEEARKLAEEQKLAAELRVEEEKLKVAELEAKLKVANEIIEKFQKNGTCVEYYEKVKSDFIANVVEKFTNQKNEMLGMKQNFQIIQTNVETLLEQMGIVNSFEERLKELEPKDP